MHEVLIIGCGLIAGGFDADRAPDALPFTHAGAFARCPAFTVTACVDPDAERRSAFQARWNVSEGGADLAALAQPGRFAVISICSPTELHRAHMEQALTLRPKVIFCEKPVAKTSAENSRACGTLQRPGGVACRELYSPLGSRGGAPGKGTP
ncbi:Gfo/Idh/MocA family oxidoreductase [Sphingomonas leidyi]|uniref:Gfo/Idh/MocA family oxidoreductase n=1 Tax=Sphingomonas leidyi TaxID=68569 RepID=UPI0036D2189D